MKLSQKLFFGVLLLLCISVGIVSALLLRQSFSDTLKLTTNQNVGLHTASYTAIGQELINIYKDEKQYIKAISVFDIASKVSDNQRISIINKDGSYLFTGSEFSFDYDTRNLLKEQSSDNISIKKIAGINYMFIKNKLINPFEEVTIISSFDMSYIFESRKQQVINLILTEFIVMLILSVPIFTAAKKFGKNLDRLNEETALISQGQYDLKSKINSGDELKDLSGNIHKMAQEIALKVEGLQQSVKSRDDFVSAFTHEVKTPMTSIIGYADILRAKRVDEEFQQTAGNYIYSEGKRLLQLSEKLLSFMGLSDEILYFNENELNNIFSLCKGTLPSEMEVRIEFVPFSDSKKVNCEQSLVVALLRNLLFNAVAAGGDENVVVSALQKENTVVVSVKDRGCGIPKEALTRIIEPFYRIDKARNYENKNNGIGLSIAQKIAELHYGGLIFESEVGVGTTVSFTLEIVKGGHRK